MARLSFHDRSRREFLRLGGLGLPLIGGLSPFASLMNSGGARASDKAAPKKVPGFGRAKSVLLVYCCGGQSQIDTWDPKPEAPAEVRGEFRSIDTAVPGTYLGELMPEISKLTDKFSIVRSMSHLDLDHGSATYLSLTGKYFKQLSSNPDPAPTDEPTIGAVLRKLRPSRTFPYDAVHLNAPLMSPREPAAGQNAGFLGAKCEPMLLGNVTQSDAVLPELQSLPELPAVRMHQRQSLKASLDGYSRDLQRDPRVRDSETLYSQAMALLDAPQSRAAFDLNQEPAALRDRYGRNQSGQALLMARRLVEAGLPLVTVFWSPSNRGQDTNPDITDAYGWDTHNDIFSSLREHLMPRFDQGFSALMRDLDERGLLDSTLVVCLGEFGRAPLVALEPKFKGASPGRKHWANVYSIVFAGAGVQPGTVVGKSDRIGGRPDSDRYGPWDTVATIYSALGIDPAGHYTDSLSRPIPLSVGRPITALY
jgi:hypothetical protein